MEMLGFSSFLILLNWPASFPAVHSQLSCETNLVGPNTFIIVITERMCFPVVMATSLWFFLAEQKAFRGAHWSYRETSSVLSGYSFLRPFITVQRNPV